MSSYDVVDPDSAKPSAIGVDVQTALVETLPSLLLLLADTREQLEEVRTKLAEALTRADASNRAEEALREVVHALQHDLALHVDEEQSLRIRLDKERESLSQVNERLVEVDETLKHRAEAARQAEERAGLAEQQLQDIRSSRTWRLADP